MRTEEWRRQMREAVSQYARDPFDEDVWNELTAGARYVAADFTQDPTLGDLDEVLAALDRERGTGGNRLYYLAVPPSALAPIARRLPLSRRGHGWARIVVEKPFGRDLASARRLTELLHRRFDEGEIYRIDHYLGKDAVQNLFVLRFANVSGQHCKLTLENGYWFVQDLNSQNGIRVNGSHVMRKRLDPNDTLSIAKHKYKINYSPEDLGATGPPPSDEEDITTVLGKSLLERAGLSRRHVAAGGDTPSRRFNPEADPGAEFKKKEPESGE